MTALIINHTIPEVARIIRCSSVNVYKLIRTGELVDLPPSNRSEVC